MQRLSDLALVLKTYPYAERDLVTVLLTENHGRITAMAKGAIHSRRYGGSLNFLSASQVTFVQKPGAEMGRLEEATIQHEFASISGDYERLTIASFMAEFCLKFLEPYAPARELFLILSNALFRLDEGKAPVLILNAFLSKALRGLGYSPNLANCVQCQKSVQEVHELALQKGEIPFYWNQEAGGMICSECALSHQHQLRRPISVETLVLFHRLTVQSFKEMAWNVKDPHNELYRILINFLHHHIPGSESGGGLKSLKLLDEAVAASQMENRNP